VASSHVHCETPYRVAPPEIFAVRERSVDGDAGSAELWIALEQEG
jgi:hypothetical protein